MSIINISTNTSSYNTQQTITQITITLTNTYNLTDSCVGQPIIYNNTPIGAISDVTSQNIFCNIYPRFISYYPEYSSNTSTNISTSSNVSALYINF